MIDEPRKLSIRDYTYELPDERIARFPLDDRSSSALLVYRNGEITKSVFGQIQQHIPAGSRLVFNNTKVIHARLRFREAKGALIECFCLEPAEGMSADKAFAAKSGVDWICMVGNNRKWKSDPLALRFEGSGGDCELRVERLRSHGRDFVLRFNWSNPSYRFSDILEHLGELPIPPYLKRETEQSDKLRYNTVYARQEGSVAAPTAGLHFTTELLSGLKTGGIEQTHITLHVGAGTFRQVSSETMDGHEMHAEEFIVSDKALMELKHTIGSKPLIAVGTTSLRVLESLYWFGCKLVRNKDTVQQCIIGQWDPYEHGDQDLTAQEAIEAVRKWMDERSMSQLNGYTRLMVAPGYHFRVIDGLITNFHQPGSTLLLLVAALIGDEWQRVYQYAMDNNFRFLSYGDSSLLFRK